MCEQYPAEIIRFYACGGDGTVNEVLNGVMNYDNAILGIYPNGTGNDFVCNFPQYDSEISIESLVTSDNTQKVDVMKVNNRYAINVCNIGMDSSVAHDMEKYKRIPFISGKMAYILSLIFNFLKQVSVKLTICINDVIDIKDEYFITAIANGKRYGGSFLVAPSASVNDGSLFFCSLKKIPFYLMLKLVNIYRKGYHVSNTKYEKYFILTECNKVTIKSSKPIPICYDGEEFYSDNITISVYESMVDLVIPNVSNVNKLEKSKLKINK